MVEGGNGGRTERSEKRSNSEPTANLRLLLEQFELVLGAMQTERQGKAEGEKKGSR